MKYTVGIDLGGTNIAVGLCDENHTLKDKLSVPTVVDKGADKVAEDMAGAVAELLRKNGLTAEDILSVGIATPGTANTETGVVEYANNLPFLHFPIAEAFKKYLPVKKVLIANDANAAALGEALAGSAKGAKTAVMVTLGTGVGSGIILDGKIFAGGINYAGAELGHTVIVVGGRQCSCGRRGCWEAYSSATALTRKTEEVMTELRLKNLDSLLFEEAKAEGKTSARTAFEAAKRGDAYAQKIVDWYLEHLAAGIANIVNTFQPEVISIGGGVSNQKENLVAPLRELVRQEQYTRNNKVITRIVTATLGNDAGIIGAAGLC